VYAAITNRDIVRALLIAYLALATCWILPIHAAETKQIAPADNPPASAEDTSEAPVAGPALPRARSIDLDKPVEDENLAEPQVEDAQAPASTTVEEDAPPLVMLGTEVPPLTSTRLSWSPDQSFEGLASPTPVLVINGARPGPTLCLTAAIHGDELNGIEIVRRVLYDIEPEELSGAVIGVPIVNLQGFQRRSRYLTDRRDLNRHFPGSPAGSSAARIAYSFFHEVIEHCSALVDIHTGSFDRTNLPQLRADLSQAEVVNLTEGFGATVVLHSTGASGTLRRAAVEQGIPAVTLEVGGPMRLQQSAVKHSVKSLQTLLDHLDMVKSSRIWGAPEPVYYRSQWLRADVGGILLSEVELGEKVDQGDTLGSVTNPITNVRTEIISPIDGRVLGMALDQVVLPGFAAYHIGTSEEAQNITALEADAGEAPPQDESEDDGSSGIVDGEEADTQDSREDAASAAPEDEIMQFD